MSRPASGTLGAVLLLACGGTAPGGAPAPDRYPAAISGQWIDLDHTSTGDTSIWLLEPGGHDDALRVRLTDQGVLERSTSHHGRWFVRPSRDAGAGPEICFIRRPGRDAVSCIAFRLDTLLTEGQPRRRLFLSNYRGSHRTQNRELWERLPGS